MALQSSIVDYFNNRKRAASSDEPYGKSDTAKVRRIENYDGITAKPVEKIHVFNDSPKSTTPKSATAPKLQRKTPRTATRISSKVKIEATAKQSDIRKSLFPTIQKDKIDGQNEEQNVNVPFEVRGLPSPKKKITRRTPVKAIPPLEKLEDKLEKIVEKEEKNKTLPVKEAENKQPKESAADLNSEVKKELGLSNIKKRLLSKASRLNDLKKALDKVNQGNEKLKEIETRKAAIESSPKLKKFNKIELEILTSPTKPLMDEVKAATSPSLLRTAVFKSPTKFAPGKMPYISPRKLFDNPTLSVESKLKSPTKSPSFQRYYTLASAGKPTLVLPYKYKLLAELFRSVDTIVAMMFNRKESITFEKVKTSVQQMEKKVLSEHFLAQMLRVLPNCFTFTREKRRTFGKALEHYELVLKPVLKHNDDGTVQDTVMTPSEVMQRRRDFYDALLELAKDHHEVFLKSLDPPLEIPKEKLTRWHPDFNVDSCPDIEPVELPPVPEQDKCSTAKDVLIRARDMIGANSRMEKALERLSEKRENSGGVTPAAQAIPSLTNALKGIPKSLLEKVRARQAAKAAELLTRPPEETKRRLELTRLPEIARILRNLYVLERKNVLSKHTVVEKVQTSYREMLSRDVIQKHIDLLVQSVPGWISCYDIDDESFIKLAKDADMSKVMGRLQELISKNQTDL